MEIELRAKQNYDGNMLDIADPDVVQVEIRDDGRVVWVHVNGVTRFRACRVGELHITDNREQAR